MQFVPLEIGGVLGIIGDSHSDSRGTLTRVWESNPVFQDFALNQASIVGNPTKGTLRGLHFQSDPFSETKIVECVSGKVFDVVVDLRKDSSTYGRHLEIELGPLEPYIGLFIPAGCAHGYLTLESNSTLIYFMDKKYSVEYSGGLLWSDPKLSIKWPCKPVLISDRDSEWPLLT